MSALAEALTKAQAEFGPIVKKLTVKTDKFTYKYADLSAVLDAVLPALSKNGLAISQPTEWTGDHLILRTVLLHSSGERLEASYPLSLGGRMQEAGAQMTYVRRYCLSALVGVAAEDDTDGQGAADLNVETKPKPEPVISKQQRDLFIEAAKATGMPPAEIKALMVRTAGVEKSDLIPVSRFDAVMQAVAEMAA